jgi:predicted dehydrogenase
LTDEKLRIAVIGTGKMGIVHSCIANLMPEAQLVALCDKNRLTRRILKKIFKRIPMVSNIDEIADLSIDAVFVTTPIPSHFQVVRTVYEHHLARNLFVEKTLASSIQEANDMCRLAIEAGGVNMVGYLRRFYVTFKKAKELMASDEIGRITHFEAYAYSSDFLGADIDVGLSRGGVLRDLGCHAIDLALWFFGDFEVTSAAHAHGQDSNEDSLNFNISKNEGLNGSFRCSWRAQGYRLAEVGFSIFGSKGKIAVNDDRVELDLKNGEKSTWYRHDLNDNAAFWLALPEYYREDQHFIRSIAERTQAHSSFASAAKVDKIIGYVEKKVGGVVC